MKTIPTSATITATTRITTKTITHRIYYARIFFVCEIQNDKNIVYVTLNLYCDGSEFAPALEGSHPHTHTYFHLHTHKLKLTYTHAHIHTYATDLPPSLLSHQKIRQNAGQKLRYAAHAHTHTLTYIDMIESAVEGIPAPVSPTDAHPAGFDGNTSRRCFIPFKCNTNVGRSSIARWLWLAGCLSRSFACSLVVYLRIVCCFILVAHVCLSSFFYGIYMLHIRVLFVVAVVVGGASTRFGKGVVWLLELPAVACHQCCAGLCVCVCVGVLRSSISTDRHSLLSHIYT